jgi:hypothetical protein
MGLVAWLSDGVTRHFHPANVCAVQIANRADLTVGYRCVATIGDS